MPEPKIPPPPPPGQMAAPVPARNSRPATLQSQNSWNAPPQKPPQPQPQQSWRTPSTPAETGGYDNHGGVGGGGSGGGGGGLRNQDSYDDWEDDDDWDDDDSSTTTEQHQVSDHVGRLWGRVDMSLGFRSRGCIQICWHF